MTAAEYFVFSKRFGRLDTTLGVGFGALGLDANMRNPFASFHESFNYRDSSVGQGGNSAFSEANKIKIVDGVKIM